MPHGAHSPYHPTVLEKTSIQCTRVDSSAYPASNIIALVSRTCSWYFYDPTYNNKLRIDFDPL